MLGSYTVAMANDAPTMQHGDEYVMMFQGGPYDGQTDRRISTDGSWDTEVTELVNQNGLDTMLVYRATGVRQRGDQVQVLYVWDQHDSEPLQDPEDRWDFDI
jgi:hypothetical protein